MEAAMPLNEVPEKSAKPQKKEFDRKVMTEGSKDIRYIAIDEVHIHYNTMVIDGHRGYQRALNPRKIDKMVEEFEPDEITAIVVSQREDGSYWVLDGQHRLEALKLLGKQVILCDVRTGLTIPQEARLFYRLNAGTTRVPSWDQFQARLAWDPVAQNIVREVESFGYRLDRSGNSPRGIAAVRALEKIFRRGYLAEVLDIVSHVWRTDAKALDAAMLEGLAIFLHTYKEQDAYDKDRLLDILAITPSSEVYQRQRQLIVEMGRGSGQPAVTVAMALRDIYNGRRRSAKKLYGPPVSGAGKVMGYSGRGGPRAKNKE